MSPAHAPTGGQVATRLRAATGAMRDSERRVVDVILGQPDVVADASVSEVAALARTATSTVVRACQTAGFSGFHELKLSLLTDLARRRPDPAGQTRELGAGSTPEEALRLVFRLSAETLDTAAATIDAPAFAELVARLAAARRVLVVGLGTSMSPAQDAAYRLQLLGLIVSAPTDSHGLEIQARQLDASDVCLLISHSGATRDSLQAAQVAKQAGAYVAVISSFARSPLTEVADAVLVAGGPKQGFRLEAMTSRLCHIALVDAIFVALALADPDRFSPFLDLASVVTAGRLV
ncbi:MurR/RpiR family transcriptional regulator [Actinacidiphila rubida]|uniref:Transcriptional regulator, RpiR family n=1 Tax=Actinacidiphila rubida TaxID=310780 RepID=A0A1H8PUQ1_9ACTN|nr:MurR/RpiR family transcriptional regulator [Actinacidiphila rubida]SEO45468.1 transcriptional regulator, RpiR family [Actinacidiphila rubida]